MNFQGRIIGMDKVEERGYNYIVFVPYQPIVQPTGRALTEGSEEHNQYREYVQRHQEARMMIDRIHMGPVILDAPISDEEHFHFRGEQTKEVK